MKHKPLIITHRGRTAGKEYRENTLEAFEHAIKVGVDMIEFDVRRTADGQLIIFHDRAIKGRRLSKLTYDEIKSRLGFTPPLFTQALALAGRIMLDIELKEDGYVDETVKLIREHCQPEQVIITSFLTNVIKQVKQLAPEFKTGLIITHPAGAIKRAGSCHADYLVIYYPMARFGILNRAAKAGLPCLVWTVNNRKALRKNLTDPRIAGIITNAPERAIQIAG